ncbi:MAG: hypothetical protein Q8R53_04885 [Nanoarchaeota archaeon]|nr:hypothetical protein [Nanoarchaeota archaeon]
MKAPSDGLLLVLFLVALGVTVTSTLVTLHNGGYLGGNFLTGAAVTTAGGEANLTVNAVTSITNQNFTINFGSGYVNASCNFCSMDSNKTFINYFGNGSNTSSLEDGRTCCVSFTEVSSGFLLENTGNTNLSVGYRCTGNCTHSLYIGGNLAPSMGGLEIKVTSNFARRQYGETGGTDSAESCLGGGTLYGPQNTNGWNITNTSANGGALNGAGLGDGVYVVLGSVGHWLCGNSSVYPLAADNSRDAAVIDINVTIPVDALGTGVRTSFNITFNATSSA